MARSLIVVLFMLSLQGCKNVCCRAADGSTFLASESCGEATEVRRWGAWEGGDLDDKEAECQEFSTAAGPCDLFCEHVTEVCPTDSGCLTSCVTEASTPPSEADIACADNATDCDGTNACWAAFF